MRPTCQITNFYFLSLFSSFSLSSGPSLFPVGLSFFRLSLLFHRISLSSLLRASGDQRLHGTLAPDTSDALLDEETYWGTAADALAGFHRMKLISSLYFFKSFFITS